MTKDDRINPELYERLEARKRALRDATPEGRYRPELDTRKPASMQPGADRLALFWIAYFLIWGGFVWYFGAKS